MSEAELGALNMRDVEHAGVKILAALKAHDVSPDLVNAMALLLLGVSTLSEGLSKEQCRLNIEAVLHHVYDAPGDFLSYDELHKRMKDLGHGETR
jgi:hypothetical protein